MPRRDSSADHHNSIPRLAPGAVRTRSAQPVRQRRSRSLAGRMPFAFAWRGRQQRPAKAPLRASVPLAGTRPGHAPGVPLPTLLPACGRRRRAGRSARGRSRAGCPSRSLGEGASGAPPRLRSGPPSRSPGRAPARPSRPSCPCSVTCGPRSTGRGPRPLPADVASLHSHDSCRRETSAHSAQHHDAT